MDAARSNAPGENRAVELQIPCILFLVLTPLFVGLRLWSRRESRSGIGWDDWTILGSFICCLLVSALMMASCYWGFGQHIENLTVPNKLMTLKLFYVAQAFYKVTINLTKVSILLLYLRIFVQKWFRTSCCVLLGLIVAYMIGTVSASIWQCTPIPRAWDRSVAGTCIDITANWYANAAFSIVTDVCILLLPMHPLYSSRLPAQQKIALMGVFALGVLYEISSQARLVLKYLLTGCDSVTVTSILRMQTLSFSSRSPDTTYDLTSSIWTIIEDNVAIICACLPMCYRPLSLLFPSVFAMASRSQSSRDSHPYSTTETSSGAQMVRSETWSPSSEDRAEKGDIDLTVMRPRLVTDPYHGGLATTELRLPENARLQGLRYQ